MRKRKEGDGPQQTDSAAFPPAFIDGRLRNSAADSIGDQNYIRILQPVAGTFSSFLLISSYFFCSL